jgi:HSP20 family molecular chaperone IbpA
MYALRTTVRYDGDYVYQIEVPGVAVECLDVIVERYDQLNVQVYVNVIDANHTLFGKHLLMTIGFEYSSDISCELCNGILIIRVPDPYTNPIHLPIHHVH